MCGTKLKEEEKDLELEPKIKEALSLYKKEDIILAWKQAQMVLAQGQVIGQYPDAYQELWESERKQACLKLNIAKIHIEYTFLEEGGHGRVSTDVKESGDEWMDRMLFSYKPQRQLLINYTQELQNKLVAIKQGE